MDFRPRNIINGQLLRQFNGKHVSLLVNVENRDASGRILNGTTTDNHNVRIELSEPLNQHIKDWVEVIGLPSGHDAIKCKEIILFDHKADAEPFDTDSHNMAVQFLHNCSDIFKTSAS